MLRALTVESAGVDEFAAQIVDGLDADGLVVLDGWIVRLP